ncbi:MAG: FtsX-like permease family protein [Flavobacteriales bacterium]|nr:FtsX-like permease family protein [Flavobacteriales bacterium]
MSTLIKIAWRNVWRNKIRSGVVIISIVLGIWAGLFVMAMTLGLNEQRMNGAISTYLSHIQVHDTQYSKEQNINYYIQNKEKILNKIESDNNIKAYAKRTIVTAMAANSNGSYGVQIVGINPAEEKKLTSISDKLIEGTYLNKFKRNPIIIGNALADKLNLNLRSKIVITLQDINSNIVSTSFRVEGIFRTSSSMFDEATLFVKMDDLEQITGLSGQIHEIAILANSIDNTEKIKSNLNKDILGSKAETWSDIAPELGYANEMMSRFIYIFMGIIFLALAFSIINTMLMAVLERRKELGMLMSVGMNKSRIFSMITLETLFISALATPIGMLLSFWTISYFGEVGIDLSAVAKGLESLGIGTRIYTFLPRQLYINITFLSLLVTFVSALFPARRALKLNPVEAIKAL